MFYKQLKSGIRLIVEKMQGSYSCCMGVMVGVGSGDETAEENGISHFIEHTTFKGTKKRNAFQISDDTEYLGAKMNAYTSKEVTFYYVKSTFDKVDESFEILSDMFVSSTYPEDELEREKGVVIEEIDMTDDTPDELCLDLLSEAYFGSSGLGKTILGPKENVRSFTKEDIKRFRDKYYTAQNSVIVFAGNVDEHKAEELVLKFIEGKLPQGEPKKAVVQSPVFGVKKAKKEIEQTHVALAFNGIKFNDEFSDYLNVASTILGGGMSSRLFQNIRERQGLCYTVYSYPSFYSSCGSLAVYAGVNQSSFEKAYSEILKEISLLQKDGVGEKEFLRAKNSILSSLIMSQESNVSLAIAHAKNLLITGSVYDFKQKIESIEKLEFDKLNAFIKGMDFSKKACSVVTKNPQLINF